MLSIYREWLGCEYTVTCDLNLRSDSVTLTIRERSFRERDTGQTGVERRKEGLSRERTLSVVLVGWAPARFLARGELRAATVWRTVVTDKES